MTDRKRYAAIRAARSAISRIEHHAGDIRLSTPGPYATALGRALALRGPRRPRRPASR